MYKDEFLSCSVTSGLLMTPQSWCFFAPEEFQLEGSFLSKWNNSYENSKGRNIP